ncbi:MAG: PEGA domain-containing protein [Sideroxydans sp.]|nr:PEGA domain-containing protein [Sideroxydans sp.]
MLNFRVLALLMVLPLVTTACALLGSVVEPGNEVQIREDSKPSANARQEKYAISVRVAGYVDAREVDSPRRLGNSSARIVGLTGKDIFSDRNVTETVAASMTKRLADAGMQVQATDTTGAQFQLSGIVKVLRVDIKGRDSVDIAIESTLTEAASGKVIWSGVVVEKAERFAGTSGNGKKDVAEFVRFHLGVVSNKTTESILSVLMATRPELFNMAVGIKPVQGVTVFSNSAGSAASPVVPSHPVLIENGTLMVKSMPSHAKVYVDGVYFGLTPLKAEIVVGVHEVSVRLDKHQNAFEKVSVRKGENTELEMSLSR